MKRFGLLLAAMTLASAPVWADTYNAPAPMAAALLPGPASPGMARIYIYREDVSPMHPEWTAVWLGGSKLGDSAPGTFFYRDVQPGTYTLSVNSDMPYSEQKKTLLLRPGSTVFVKVFAVEGYGITMSGGGGSSRFGGGAVSVSIPNVFGERIIDPRIAQPEISRLQPEG
jgi:hypothetical protein